LVHLSDNLSKMNEEDIDEIFKLATLVKKDKDALQLELIKIREQIKKQQERLRKLYQLLR